MEILIAFIAGYFVLLATLSLAARPARARLKELADELGRDYGNEPFVADYLRSQLGTAYSWRAAPIDTFVLIAALIVPAQIFWMKANKVKADHPTMFKDPRFGEFDDAYSVSIAAVNPIFGLFMYAAIFALVLKMMAYARRSDVRREIPPVGMMSPA